ncbi:hypothetical protein [Mycobacterium sp. D16Q16]|uniref:hypothetical protein n=1 Tax=Mycobacterium sp. D16Q16 TaxID=1855659 RepID=UPI0009932363|nr:hypothetical protein [Mycobacterium sp. D16Q16]
MAPQITQGNKETLLVRDLRSHGITISDSVEDELKLYKSVLESSRDSESTFQHAQSELGRCSASKWDSSLKAFNKAAFEMFTTKTNEQNLIKIAAQRLYFAVSDATDDWESEIVDHYNAVVDEHRLNEVAQDLPDFTGQTSVLTLTETQGKAVDLWRNASVALSSWWGLYSRLATLQGHEVGPMGVDGQGTNLFTACVFGDPGSFGMASQAARIMASSAGGSTTARAYGPLIPHVIPALCGYELQLSTLDDAAAIRRAIQPETTGTGGDIPATQMNYL